MGASPLRKSILRTLAGQGSLSTNGISIAIGEPEVNVQRELKTMARRGLCSEMFTNVYEITDRGRREAPAPPPPARATPYAHWGINPSGQDMPPDEPLDSDWVEAEAEMDFIRMDAEEHNYGEEE